MMVNTDVSFSLFSDVNKPSDTDLFMYSVTSYNLQRFQLDLIVTNLVASSNQNQRNKVSVVE